MEITIKWKHDGKWRDFNTDDILDRPRNHALDLFNRAIPVVIRQGDTVISNDGATRQQYHKIAVRDGLTVLDLAKVERSESKLSEVGFI